MPTQSDFILFKRSNGYFYYRLKGEPNNVSHSTRKKKQSEALKVVNEKLQQRGLKPKEEITFQEWVNNFYVKGTCPLLKSKNTSNNFPTDLSIKKARRQIELYLLETKLSKKLLSLITETDIINLLDDLKQDKTFGTYQKIFMRLRTIIRFAYKEGLIQRDFMVGFSWPRSNNKEETKSFDKPRLKQMFDDFDNPYPFTSLKWKFLFFVEATTGVRGGEVRSLKWEDIDFTKGLILVKRSLSYPRTKDTEPVIGPPKNRTSRFSKLPEITIKVLKRWKELQKEVDEYRIAEQQNHEGFIFTEDEFDFSFKKHLEDFQHNFGKCIRDNRYNWEFKKVKKRLGIEDKNIRPHSFRHTANSILLEGGVNPRLLRASFGWGSETIQDIYTKFHPESFDIQTQVIDEMFFGDKDGQLIQTEQRATNINYLNTYIENQAKTIQTHIDRLIILRDFIIQMFHSDALQELPDLGSIETIPVRELRKRIFTINEKLSTGELSVIFDNPFRYDIED